MSDLAFQHVSDSFYIPADNTAADARCGFLLATAASNPPATIPLTETLAMDGFFVFVPALPQGDALAAFIANARSYLTDPSRSGTRFGWFPSPTATGPDFTGTTLAVAAQGGNYLTVEATFLQVTASIQLRINGGDAITVSGGSLLFTPSGTPNALYVTPTGGEQQILEMPTPLSLPLIGSGTSNGAFSYQVQVGGDWLAYLDIGLRLFYQDPDWGTTLSYRYPLIDEAASALTLYATTDPLSAAEPDRSNFAFLPATAEGSTVAVSIPTYYRTTLGHQVNLTPTGPTSRLVFATSSDTPGDMYLVPSGEFASSAPTAPATATADGFPRLMCGLSGVEYLIMPTGDSGNATTRLVFQPGGAAFVKGFVPGQSSPSDMSLTGDMTTSWAYAYRVTESTTDQPVTYAAQPHGSVLHQPGAQVANFDPTNPTDVVKAALAYMEIPSFYLPTPTQAEADGLPGTFPMLPYGRIEGDETTLASIVQLESQLLSPVRKAAINGIKQAPAPTRSAAALLQDTPLVGATPQGLLATYSGDYSVLTQVLLAQTDAQDGQSDPSQLYLQNIARESDLWMALQSNQLFLVITDPTKLTDHLGGLINIQGWEFHLDPSLWRSDTVLIFKFFKDKTLKDLAAAGDLWTMSAAFNPDLKSAQQKIKQSICYAVNKCCGNQPDQDCDGDCLQTGSCPGAGDFENFLFNVVLNPQWNGILALNVKVPPTDMPDQLKSLAAGLNVDQFFAHHVGINASPIKYDPTAGSLAPQRSSVFGLIYYEDPALLTDIAIPYNFKVLTLKVLFQNSGIADFTSQVDLLVNSLFSQKVTLQGGTGNNILFDGVYQEHDGVPSYVFLTQAASTFAINTVQVLESVTLSQGEFITQATESETDTVQSQFKFWGSMAFKELEFDAFSFGPGPNGAGLSFANLAIDMATVVAEDPDEPSTMSFTFDPSHLIFDTSTSSARSNSLYARFPLKLVGFTGSGISPLPTQRGFMSISSPLTQGQLADPWYGLQFELQLGSMGGLAEKADFVATVLVAWTPASGAAYNVWLGLKLPGSTGGQREISLQGIFAIKMQNILFLASTTNGTTSYVLRLQTITFSFLSLSLPPNARIDFLLFGDPAGTDNKNLGWYAVYDQGVKPKPKKPTPIPGLGGSTSLQQGG